MSNIEQDSIFQTEDDAQVNYLQDSDSGEIETSENENDRFYFDYSVLQQVYTQNQPADDEEWSYSFEDEETATKSLNVDDDNNTQTHNVPNDPNIQKKQCVLVVCKDGQTFRCQETADKNRGVAQLFGTWEVDADAVNSVKENADVITATDDEFNKFFVCSQHFLHDQNTLHPGAKSSSTEDSNVTSSSKKGSNVKSSSIKNSNNKSSSTKDSKISRKRCLFCNKNKYFFTRSDCCAIHHKWMVCNRNIQVPCRGLFECPAINECAPCVKPSHNAQKSRFVCQQCFEEKGGHLHKPPGRGKKKFTCTELNLHVDDTNKALQKAVQFLDFVAKSENVEKKEQLLKMLVPVVQRCSEKQQNPEDTREPETVPSLFLFNTILRLNKINTTTNESQTNVTPTTCKDFGTSMALQLWNSRQDLKENKQSLECPQSLEEYQTAMPNTIFSFFHNFIQTLQEKKLDIANKKRRQRGSPPIALKEDVVTKISVFLVSIILTIAFRGWKIWLTDVMSSLCRRPKLISSLQALLRVAHVVSHSRKHQVQLERRQMSQTNPRTQLSNKPGTWNLALIDNIDFKGKTFAYGNIFDAVRKSSHATLRMVFQFHIPNNGVLPPAPMQQELSLGPNRVTDTWDEILPEILAEMCSQHGRNFHIDDINKRMKKHVQLGCRNVDPPNVVILEAGEAPSCDANVHKACDMYLEDLGISGNNCLDIACDEALFRRLNSYKNSQQKVRAILGQWHTNKDMCAVIVTIFSGYGLFSIAASLGVRFLDKLEKTVDYRATFRTLELVWASVAIALNLHMQSEGKSINDIPKCQNKLLKVWHLFYCWAGWLKLHKIGIRMGNFELQIECLRAFAPLFPVAGKNNYTASVTRFLATLHDNPELQYYLEHAASINLTDDEHYLGYDEALQTFGVKFIKQTLVRDPTNVENLKNNIRSAQAVHKRLTTALDEFVDDPSIGKSARASKTRQDAMWKTVELLLDAFKWQRPTVHPFFSATKELTETGYEKLFNCYEIGLQRLRKIERQDIRRLEPRVTTGRRKKDIERMTSKTYFEMVKSKPPEQLSVHEPIVVIDSHPLHDMS
jgi:hypothetical protein